MKTTVLAFILLLCCGLPTSLLAQLSPTAQQAYEVYQKAVQLNNVSNKYEDALTALNRADSLLVAAPDAPDSLWAQVRFMQGTVLHNLSEFAESMKKLRESDRYYQLYDAYGGRADCYLFLANNTWWLRGAQEAIPFFDTAIALAEKDTRGIRRNRGRYYADKGYALGELGQFETGLAQIETGLRKDSSYYGKVSRQYVTSLMSKATVYNYWGEYAQAVGVFKEAVALTHQVNLGADSPWDAPLYGNLGAAYFNMGDLEEAERYYQKCFALFQQVLPPESPYFAMLYSRFGLIAQNRYQYPEALEWTNKAMAYYDQLDPNTQFSVKHGLAMALNELGEYQQADSIYRELEEMARPLLGPENYQMALLYEGMADNQHKSGNTEAALKYLDEASAVYLANYPPEHLIHTRPTGKKAFVCLHGKQYRRAVAYANAGLLKFQEHPDPNAWQVYRDAYLALLGYRAEALYYLTDQLGVATLDSALADYRRYEQCLDTIFALDRSPDDKLAYQTYSSGFFRNAMFALGYKGTLATYDLNTMWRLSEKSKAYLLREGFRQSAMPVAGSVLDSLQRLVAAQQFYQKKIFDARQDSQAREADIIRWEAAIFDLELQRRATWEAFKAVQDQTPYYLEADRGLIDISGVQRALVDTHTVLLEFVDMQHIVYIFAITADTCVVVERRPPFSLDSLIRQMRLALTSEFFSPTLSAVQSEENARRYVAAASALYAELIAPVSPWLKERVIMVPDGALNYLPFDALLRQMPENPTRYHSHAYFGVEHLLSYNYSATMLAEMQRKKHPKKPTGAVLAMAPFYETGVGAEPGRNRNSIRDDSPKPLPASGPEVERICDLFGGKPYLGSTATKTVFEQLAGQHKIIHLSTHGWADSTSGNFGWVAFAPSSDSGRFEKFYINDLYHLRLNADMVVASACETGVGELKRGEGVLSLARAFTYAGAKSLVTTLWSVSDRETAELMTLFYEQLHLEADKDVALWQAKKNYIRSHKTDGKAHPFYWASFLPIGDMRRL